MSGGKKKSQTHAKRGKYSKQKDRTAANRRRKREKHFSMNPNDKTEPKKWPIYGERDEKT